MKINKLTFPLIITQRILEDDIVFHNQTFKVMKYIGILNFLNQIIVMIICAAIIFNIVAEPTACGIFAFMPVMALFCWELLVFVEKMADAFPVKQK